MYGRERLGEFWGYTAGWSFVVGKTASCAAMALTVGIYAWPAYAHALAVAAVVALTAINYAGVQKSALLTRVIVAVVLAVLAAVVVIVLGFGDVDDARLFGDDVSVGGVLQAAGLLFFAFAGYARIATLGEEVRDPERTIPRAIPIALGITLAVYATVAAVVLAELGSAGLASSSAPLADAVRAAGQPGFEPVVRAGAAIAALGSLLSLFLGVSRTTLAMARDRHLPHALAAVHPRFASPHRAELVVGAVVAVIAAVADVRGAIGFSAFAVLVYYAIANASAMTLGPQGDSGGRPYRLCATGRPASDRVGSGRCQRGADRRIDLRPATAAVGLDRGRQGHEDAVLADLVDHARRLERVPQILLDPGHRENNSAAF